MNITVTMAKRILKELVAYTDNQIGIINNEGIILAHTQETLQGHPCLPASRICHENIVSELTVTYAEADIASNTFPGIYYPVYVQEVLCFILLVHFGIESDLFSYGKMLRGLCQMTAEKILFSESFRKPNYVLNSFLTDWISGKFADDTKQFFQRASAYQLDISYDAACAVLSLSHSSFNAFMELSLENLFEKFRLLNINYRDQYVLILNSSSMEEITRTLQAFAERLSSVTNRFLISVGNVHRSTQLHMSYNEALKVSLRYAKTTYGIKFYQDEIIQLYLHDAPEHIKKEVTERMFSSYSSQERKNIYELIQTYTECNGSLQQTAKRLFIHKNTVQYRIESLRNHTGYDLRILKDYISLYLACIWLEQ